MNKNQIMLKVNRKKTLLRRIDDLLDDYYVKWTPSKRVSFIWNLTEEVWSLKDKKSAQRRLQRNITHFKKAKS